MGTAEFEARVLRTISEHQMIEKGDTVIVALSGGGDSMALFHFLYLHAGDLGVRLRAAHVNHGIRGAASDADEAFVRAQCAQRGVPLDVKRLALGARVSEDQARRARYGFFGELCRRHGAKLATAHTASDRAETVLLCLARGASLRGAAGIPYVRGPFLRPLLDVNAAQARAYLERSGVPFCIDETNGSDRYARNRVRRAAVPALESVNENAVLHIAQFSEDAREAADYLDGQARALLAGAKRAHPAEVLEMYDAAALAAAPRAVRRAALRLLIAPVADPSRAHIEQCEELLRGAGAVVLGGQARLCVRQGLARVEPLSVRAEAFEIPFSEGEFSLPDGRMIKIERISFEKYEKMRKEAQNPLFSCADYDKIKTGTLLRTRCAGDWFAPCGRSGTKTLKKLLNEQRLSAAARASVVLCARGSEVLWASGIGCSRNTLPGRDTVEVAVITIQKRGTV